jgi:hypothetical protein
MRFASDHPEFRDLLRAAAEALKLPIWIVEKDYYVTRALRALSEHIGDQFLFKGGTSLSKAWKLIERFSEDIDLLFQIEQDGQPLSKNQRHKRFKVAEEIVAGTPGFTLVKPQGAVSSETGMHRESFFAYPITESPDDAIGDKIKLEMNCRGGRKPHQQRPIQSFVSEFAAAQSATDIGEDLTSFSIDCLDLTRTFIEKLFAAYYAFTIDRALRRTRHYSDLYHLAGLPEIQAFVVSDEFPLLCADVHKFSIEHWPDRPVPPGISFAQYDFLAPSAEHLAELTRNYAAERVLFFSEPPTMMIILERLRQLPFRQ